MRPMACGEYQQWISEYVDYELDEQASAILFKHLSECENCRRFLRESLQVRSFIHDDILREDQRERQYDNPGSFTTAFAFPLLALVVVLLLFLGISQVPPSPRAYNATPTEQMQGMQPIGLIPN